MEGVHLILSHHKTCIFVLLFLFVPREKKIVPSVAIAFE